MIKILTNSDFNFISNSKSNVLVGDKVKVYDFNEQAISGDDAIKISSKGYAIVESIAPDFGDGKIYISVSEAPELIIWKFNKI